MKVGVDPASTPDDAYAFRDLVCVRAILTLLDSGIPLQRIRRNIEMLRERMPELEDPVSQLRLWADGSERVVVRHDGVLQEPSGQMLLEFSAEVAPASPPEATPLVKRAPASDEDPTHYFEEGCRLDAEGGQADQARAAYERALEIHPEYADAHCNLGALHYNEGHRDVARACFEACVRAEPNHIEGNFNLANLLEEDGEDERALAHYRRALAADPFYPDLHINLALLYEKLGHPGKACDHWRRYLQVDASGPWSEVARLRLERQRDA